MWILYCIGYLGLVLGFAFVTLAIASGLYYLSELVEEHTVICKKLLYRLIYVVILLQLLLALVDRFPLWPSAFSVTSHFVYMQNLRRFPIVKLSDPVFVVSCALVLVNHYFWFKHFSAPSSRSSYPSSYPYRRASSYDSLYELGPSFMEVASFFGICVWLVPFSLFVSLSASENVLPSMGSEYATGEGSSFVRSGKEPSRNGFIKSGTTNVGMAKALVDGFMGWAGETAELMGFWRGERTRRRF